MLCVPKIRISVAPATPLYSDVAATIVGATQIIGSGVKQRAGYRAIIALCANLDGACRSLN